MKKSSLGGIAARRLLVALLVTACSCRAGTVVLVAPPNAPSEEVQRFSLASRFFGLEVYVLPESSPSDHARFLSILKSNETRAVVFSADILSSLNQKEILSALRRSGGAAVPILITGTTKGMDTAALKKWSAGAIAESKSLPDSAARKYVFGSLPEIVGPLRSQEIPIHAGPISYFEAPNGHALEVILSARDENRDVPVFVRTKLAGEDVFFESAMAPEGTLSSEDLEDPVATFAQLAPEMLFIRYAAGSHAWHATSHYANLTIDDPWLRSRYGHLDYAALLRDMQAHNYHTTIAFIPWNFDRSDPAVVSLVRDHPDRFSICVHGNNHDHAEFTDYGSKPLPEQIRNIRIALARMDRFTAQTGIPYDPVMIFPHSIAPVQTLAELKKYNFWATFNSQNVPSGSVAPADPLVVLRPVTLKFGNFASVKRSSVEGSVSQAGIAVNAFLDNPLLFYGHQGIFTKGIDAFDPVAEFVNKIQPETQWGSLGSIAEHFYLVRSRDDGAVDVMAFSPEISLENPSDKEATYYVQKEENDSAPIRSLTANGIPQSYELSRGFLTFVVQVPPRQTKVVSLQYQNDFDASKVDVSKDSLRVNLLRRISDFRDVALSGSSVGRSAISLYYGRSSRLRLFLVTALVLLCLVLSIYLYRRSAGEPRLNR